MASAKKALRDFLLRKVSVWWVVVAMVAPVVAWFFGQGSFWEWKKAGVESTRLDIDKAKASLEIREKMTATLSHIIELQKDNESRQKHADELEAKIDNFITAEKYLAQLEGRQPTVYSFMWATHFQEGNHVRLSITIHGGNTVIGGEVMCSVTDPENREHSAPSGMEGSNVTSMTFTLVYSWDASPLHPGTYKVQCFLGGKHVIANDSFTIS